MIVEKGKQVSFDYTLTVEGKVVDSSEGREPLQYTYGEGKIILGLAKRLEGLQVGDEKTITVPPEEAYGVTDPNAFKEISRTSLPENISPQVDMPLQIEKTGGRIFTARIAEVKKESIVIDLNHPLAGKTLIFQVKIVSIH